MQLCLKACRAQNGTIGNKGEIPWYVKNMETIDALSLGYPVIMGRKTTDKLVSPLPGRLNILITSETNYKKEGFHVFNSSDEALNFAKSQKNTKCFVLGGGSIFRQFLNYADTIYLTTLLAEFEGDTFFPKNFAEKFAKSHSVMYNSNIDFIFETYERQYD